MRRRSPARSSATSMRDAPEELGLAFAVHHRPPASSTTSRSSCTASPRSSSPGCTPGPVEEGERVLAGPAQRRPARRRPLRPRWPTRTSSAPLDDPPGFRNYWTAEHVGALGDEGIDPHRPARGGARPPGPSQIFIVPWGGAVARARGRGLAARRPRCAAHRPPAAALGGPGRRRPPCSPPRPPLPPRAAPVRSATGAAYLNFLGDEGEERMRAGFVPGAYERLARVKARVRPAQRVPREPHRRAVP